jgi:hypothetical protein
MEGDFKDTGSWVLLEHVAAWETDTAIAIHNLLNYSLTLTLGDLTDGAAVYDLHCILRWND